MPDGLRLALTTFTVLTVRGPSSFTRRTARDAVLLAPLVGLGLGLVAATVMFALRLATPTSSEVALPAVAAVVVLAFATRGLHLDGLVDTADGLGSYAPPERARTIMKEPGVGALGVVTLVLVLAVQVTALIACIGGGHGTASLLLATITGRLAVLAACTPRTPAASPDGLGATVAGTVPRNIPLLYAGVVALLAGLAELFDERTAPLVDRFQDAGQVVVALVVGLVVARLLRAHCVRRLGGMTGDVLGALLEVTTAVVLVVVSLDL